MIWRITATVAMLLVSACGNERDGGGSSHDPTGYRVDGGEAPLGAVDVMGKGRVWQSKALEGRARDDLACLFAGLLLYKPPTDR